MRSDDIRGYTTGMVADNVGVQRFADAMREKLKRSREEKGRGGWNQESERTVEELTNMMRVHVEKGDVVDVANFCMMIWNREHPTGLDPK